MIKYSEEAFNEFMNLGSVVDVSLEHNIVVITLVLAVIYSAIKMLYWNAKSSLADEDDLRTISKGEIWTVVYAVVMIVSLAVAFKL